MIHEAAIMWLDENRRREDDGKMEVIKMSTDDRIQMLLDEADVALKNNEYDKAMEIGEEIKTEEPEISTGWVWLMTVQITARMNGSDWMLPDDYLDELFGIDDGEWSGWASTVFYLYRAVMFDILGYFNYYKDREPFIDEKISNRWFKDILSREEINKTVAAICRCYLWYNRSTDNNEKKIEISDFDSQLREDADAGIWLSWIALNKLEYWKTLRQEANEGNYEAALEYAACQVERMEYDEALAVLEQADNKNEEIEDELKKRRWEIAREICHYKRMKIVGDASYIVTSETGEEILEEITCCREAIKYGSEIVFEHLMILQMELLEGPYGEKSWGMNEEELKGCEVYASKKGWAFNYLQLAQIYDELGNAEKCNAMARCGLALCSEDDTFAIAGLKYFLWKRDGEDETGEVPYEGEVRRLLREGNNAYHIRCINYLRDVERREYPIHVLYEKMLHGDIYAGLRYAKCAMEQGDKKECLDVLETIEANNEITDEYWLQLRWRLAGECYWADDLRKSIECFENAYELHSEEALWALLECMRRANEIDFSWKMSDAQMAILEKRALDGDGTLSFKIGISYVVWNNYARAKIFFRNALRLLSDQNVVSVKSRFVLWWIDETDENGVPYDPDVLRDELQPEAEKGDRDCKHYLTLLEEKVRKGGHRK